MRYIANRSSGKQGHAIARAAARGRRRGDAGVAGRSTCPIRPACRSCASRARATCWRAVEAALPADIAIFAAAVADWRVAQASEQKIKKGAGGTPKLALTENPDILATVAHLKAKRPPLVIGFAAETEHVVEHAKAEARAQGLRLDRRQRRLGRDRA